MDKQLDKNEVIVEWVDVKLKDTCRIIGLFINYVLIPREGFKTIDSPVLYLPIVKYVIEEIFDCKIINNSLKTTLYSQEFYNNCKNYLQQYTITNIIIGSDAVEYIWKYIKFGIDTITEGINVDKEIDKLQTSNKRKELKLKKQAIKDFQQGIRNKDEKSIEYFTNDKINQYKNISKKLRNTLLNCRQDIEKYKTIDGYNSKNRVINLSEKENIILNELGIKQKKINKFNIYRDVENDRIKKLKNNEMSNVEFSQDMIQLLSIELKTLDKIIHVIDNTPIMIYLKTLPENKWNQEYIKLEIKSEIKKAVSLINTNLSETLKEIENDENIPLYVNKQITTTLKNRIEQYQLYVSNKKCEKYDFDRDIDGCVFQSLIYVIVTLADWLELTRVKKIDFIYTLRILLSFDLQSYIIEDPSETFDNDDKFKGNFLKEMIKYGIKSSENNYKDLNVFIATIKNIENMEHTNPLYIKFNNRIRYFARSL